MCKSTIDTSFELWRAVSIRGIDGSELLGRGGGKGGRHTSVPRDPPGKISYLKPEVFNISDARYVRPMSGKLQR